MSGLAGMMAVTTAEGNTFKSSGEQLEQLKDELTEKSDKMKERIDEWEAEKDILLKELRAITLKLEETDRRLSKLNSAKKEYLKTQQEVNFAIGKLEDASGEISKRFDDFNNVGRDAADDFMAAYKE